LIKVTEQVTYKTDRSPGVGLYVICFFKWRLVSVIDIICDRASVFLCAIG